jgi:hypothetical protein
MKFMERARWLYRIVLIQHATRQILRAAWLGGAVYLFCWGANSLWGVLPNSGYWILFAVLVGFVTLLSIFFKRMKMEDFLWRVDRLFSQNEQISTAYQTARDNEEIDEIRNSLFADAAKLIPVIIRRVIDRGWRLRNDVEATIIILMLLMIVYLSGMESFTAAVSGGGLGLLPGAGSDPSFSDVFPSGIPGDTSGDHPQVAGLDTRAGGQEPVFEAQMEDPGSLDRMYRVFREMGQQLKDNPSTTDLGMALEDGDFIDAATQIRDLSENLDRLTATSRSDLAEAFSYGVRELYLSEYAQITEPLGGAASALFGGALTEIGRELDRVAEMFEALATQLQGDVYALQPNVEPITRRVEGEGDDLELNTPEDVSDLLVAPGSGAPGFGGEAGDVINLIGTVTESSGEFELNSYNFAWEDKNVVSSYFSPR